jgi:hypothetical protein
MRLVIFGMMGRCPFGGQTWLSLNWLRGFQRLGHDVWYVEDDTAWPYHPVKRTLTDDCSYAVEHIASCMDRIGLPSSWAFRFGGRNGRCWGLSSRQLDDLYRSCDALFTFATTELRDEHLAAPLRIHIESDPVMSQLRLASGDERTRTSFDCHHRIFSYGENYGAPDCGVPLGSIDYGTTRQPIDLNFWTFHFTPDARFVTTIGNYRQKGNDIAFNGEIYRWSKHHEWVKFMDLPRHTRQEFELGVFPDDPEDREQFASHGWRLFSPYKMSLDTFGAYPAFIRNSRAEFTVAKDQNVRLRSGWFSERDACYLASGKPVIAQDTGFANILPTGAGLFAVSNTDEALAAIEAINSDYERHCHAARAIAEEYFEASRVAGRLVDQLNPRQA